MMTLVRPPPEETKSGEYICSLYGCNGSCYRVRTKDITVGRTMFPRKMQRCDVGVGTFRNISRIHFQLKVIDDQGVWGIVLICLSSVRIGQKIYPRGSILQLSNSDTIFLGSTRITLSVNYDILRSKKFRFPKEKTTERVSWSREPGHSTIRAWPGLTDRYDSQGRLWEDEVDISRERNRYRAPICCDSTSGVSKQTTGEFYRMFTPCYYKFDENMGFDENYKLRVIGHYFSVRSFLSWTILKMMTWNIRPNHPLLDPRIEYGCKIEEIKPSSSEIVSSTSKSSQIDPNQKYFVIKEVFSEEIGKWDTIYLALRFFLIKDLIRLKSISNLRKFVKKFFKEKHVNEWRKNGRPIGREILERIFVGIQEVNPHGKLMSFQMMYKSWKDIDQKRILECAKDRAKKLDQFLEKYCVWRS